MKDRNISQGIWDEFSQELDAYGRTVYALDQEEKIQVHILPDEKVSPGKFKPDPSLPNTYKAKPLTIRAMRKDLFLLGDEIIFTEIKCRSCSQVLEKECWNLCPYCGERLKPSEE